VPDLPAESGEPRQSGVFHDRFRKGRAHQDL
jgi:hypothetical protein